MSEFPILPYPAPYFDSDGNELCAGNRPPALYANYLTLVAAAYVMEPGLDFAQKDLSPEEAARVAALININPATGQARPTVGFLAAVQAFNAAHRHRIAETIEQVMAENGIQVQFARQHLSTPMLYWGDACVYAFTSDGYALMKLRGNQGFTGLIEPTGNGFRSIKDGRAVTALDDALREMKEESNLEGQARLIGINRRSNTLQAFTLETVDGLHTVGVMPATSSIAAVKLPYTLAEMLTLYGKLNSEAFGFLPIHVSQLDDYARGNNVVVNCYPSMAAEAQAAFANALENADAHRLALADLIPVMNKAPRIPLNKLPEYAIDSQSVPMIVNNTQGYAVGRNHGAEMIKAATAVGLFVSPAARAYANAHANIDPISKLCAMAAPARNDRVGGLGQ